MLKSDAGLQANLMPRLATAAGIAIREDVAFTNADGKENKKIRQRAETTLQRLQEPLRRVLQQDEAVLYVLRAQSPVSLVQQVTTGWYIYQLTQCVLVVTNRRLLQFQVEPGLFSRDAWKWRSSWRMVAWGDVKDIKLSGLLACEMYLTYLNGKKEKFWGIERKDKKKLELLLARLAPSTQGEMTSASGIVQLCPKCAAALASGIYSCASCGQRFKDEQTARIRSILIPGGGYFYTGMIWLGIVDAIVESFLLLALLALTLEAAGIVPPDAGQAPASWGMVGFMLVIIAIEKWVTIYHSQHRVRDYMPISH